MIAAVGCAYPEPPPLGWLEESGWDHSSVTVGCNTSDATWSLVCAGNKWVPEGAVVNCTNGS